MTNDDPGARAERFTLEEVGLVLSAAEANYAALCELCTREPSAETQAAIARHRAACDRYWQLAGKLVGRIINAEASASGAGGCETPRPAPDTERAAASATADAAELHTPGTFAAMRAKVPTLSVHDDRRVFVWPASLSDC